MIRNNSNVLLEATIYNNLGYVLKSQNRFEDSKSAYLKTLEIRKSTLGESHNETIISMHNLAELYLAMGKEEESKKIQEDIMRIVEAMHGSASSLIDNGANST